MNMPNTRRIVLLGKTGVGKSSLANTIFGEAKFKTDHLNDLRTGCSPAETKTVNGRSITLIDTPGFFGTARPEEELKPEIVRCTTECAPGPHAFLIVLKVEKFTKQEQDVITEMCEYFSEDALKYAVIVFTHGDQLNEGQTIHDFFRNNKLVSDLMKKCGGRCHVIDNKYWKNNQQDEYRSNRFQVEEILKTIDKMVKENNGGYYTDEKLQEVEREIQKEEERIRLTSGSMPREEIRKQAIRSIFKKQVNNKARNWIRVAVIGGLLAVSAMLINLKFVKVFKKVPLFNEEAPALTEVVAEQASAIGEVADVIITPVKAIQETFQGFMNNLKALYERLYNHWHPFQ